MKTYKQFIEKMCVDVKVGDTILRGRFKNKKTIVKKISKDKHGPTINGKPALSFRLTKESSGVEYKVDDYVLLDIEKIIEREKDEIIRWGTGDEDIDKFGLEISKKLQNYAKIYMKIYSRNYSPIRVMFTTGNVYDVNEDEIIRLMTPEEIEEYDTKVDSKKYNL